MTDESINVRFRIVYRRLPQTKQIFVESRFSHTTRRRVGSYMIAW